MQIIRLSLKAFFRSFHMEFICSVWVDVVADFWLEVRFLLELSIKNYGFKTLWLNVSIRNYVISYFILGNLGQVSEKTVLHRRPNLLLKVRFLLKFRKKDYSFRNLWLKVPIRKYVTSYFSQGNFDQFISTRGIWGESGHLNLWNPGEGGLLLSFPWIVKRYL